MANQNTAQKIESEDARIDAFENEIIQTEPTLDQQKAFNKMLDGMQYTTTLLLALETWMTNVGDEEGSRMVAQLTSRMARHEAETI